MYLLLSHYSIVSTVSSLGFSAVCTKINLAARDNVLEEHNVSVCMAKVQIFFTTVTNSTVPEQYMSVILNSDSALLSRQLPHSAVLVRCTAYMANMNSLPVLMVSQCCNPQLSLDSVLQKQSYVSFWAP